MKKQFNPTIKAHLIRGAFYLLLLVAVCAIPFALAQSRSRGTARGTVARPTALPNLTALGLAVPKTHAVPANPDFAPAGVIKEQLSRVRPRRATVPGSGAVDASGAAVVKNPLAPLFPEGGCGTPGPWSTATPGPPARYRAGGSTDGQYVYVYGGGNSTGGYYNDLWRWDPTTQIWTQLANMPTAKQNIQGAYWNGKIYVPGGFNGAHITENAIYDIATNTWSTGAPLPAAQTGANVAFNNKIYNFGGNPGPQSTVTIYDIATNTWSPGAPMPVPITYGRAAVSPLFPFAYYAGGIAGVTVNTLYRYDFAANTWATMAPLQTARTSEELMTSPLGTELYAVMGGDATFFTGVPLPVSVEIYSIGTNSWSYGNPVVTKAAAPSGGRTGGNTTLMVQGGVDGTTYYNTVQVSVVPCGTPSPTATASPTPTATATPTGTPGGCQFHVLIVYADSEGLPSQLQSEIQAEPNVVAVDLFDATAGTPTLAQLQQYQIVVPFSNSPFLDGDTLGNNLADYVDGGGVVVQYGFSHYGPGQPYGVNGRWVSGNYNPYNYSTNLQFNAFSLGTFNAGHPLMAGVTMLNSDFENIVTLASGATEVAADNFGDSLVAFRPVSGGHTTVGVTAYVGAAATQSGDWGKVIVNAGNWLAMCQGGSPTPTATASPSCSPTPVILQGSIDDTEPFHNSVNGAASSCAVSPACPGELVGEFHYDTYQLTNPSSNPVCITVTLSDPTCIYSEVYLGSFDPNNACTNYLADSNLGPSYQVTVPGNATIVVVVEEFTEMAGCPSYTVTIDGLGSCPSPTPTASPSATVIQSPTATATATATATFTPTATATATVEPRSTPTPRPRPTPGPRP